MSERKAWPQSALFLMKDSRSVGGEGLVVCIEKNILAKRNKAGKHFRYSWLAPLLPFPITHTLIRSPGIAEEARPAVRIGWGLGKDGKFSGGRVFANPGRDARTDRKAFQFEAASVDE